MVVELINDNEVLWRNFCLVDLGNPGTGKSIQAKPNRLQTKAESEVLADRSADPSVILFHFLSIF